MKTFMPSYSPRSVLNQSREIVALDYQPFSIVEEINFKNLITCSEGKYQLPIRKPLSSVVIINLYKKSKADPYNKLIKDFEEIKFLSLIIFYT